MQSIVSETQVLIVDSDLSATEPLRMALASTGLMVRAIANGSAAVSVIAEFPPRLVIVDWHMPHYGAMDLIQVVRSQDARQRIAVIVLSALAAENDVVDCLTLGADDYVIKPYSLREVTARAHALLRSRTGDRRAHTLRCGDLELDTLANRAVARQEALDLSPAEYRLLLFFMSHPGKALDRSHLLAEVWGGAAGVNARVVDVNVQRLRRLLAEAGCEDYIQTLRGYGYRLSAAGPVKNTSSSSHGIVTPGRDGEAS